MKDRNAEDTAMRVALAIAEDVCPGCVIAERMPSASTLCKNQKPCPLFHPDNFYYDRQLKRFWCYNWMNAQGDDKPMASAGHQNLTCA